MFGLKIKNAHRKTIEDALEKCLCIHYSTENFKRKSDKAKVIQILEIKSGIPVEATAFIFQNKRKDKNEYARYFDFLEKRCNQPILHWRMENEKFGFRHLELVGEGLGAKPYRVLPQNKINLKRLIEAAHPKTKPDDLKMNHLFALNDCEMEGFIEGEKEADIPHREKEALRASTFRKVQNIYKLAYLFGTNNLKVTKGKPSQVWTPYVAIMIFAALMFGAAASNIKPETLSDIRDAIKFAITSYE